MRGIRKLTVRNFKSIRRLDLELGEFNVLVGANASGKSNVVEVLRFIRDLASLGIDDAVSLQGGPPYLLNFKARDEPLVVETVADEGLRPMLPAAPSSGYHLVIFDSPTVTRRLELGFAPGPGVVVLKDEVVLSGQLSGVGLEGHQEPLGAGSLTLAAEGGQVKLTLGVAAAAAVGTLRTAHPLLPGPIDLRGGTTLAFGPTRFELLLGGPSGGGVGDLAVYNIDPDSPKLGARPRGRATLEEDAGNLAQFLRGVLSDPPRKRKLLGVLGDLLPFLTDAHVQTFADKTALLEFAERYWPDRFVPASSLSDGTISLVALVAALYFAGQFLRAFEEPERSIHPSLIAKVVEMMRDAARRAQVLITTHSPEVVRHAGVENLLLVRRDSSGYTSVARAGDLTRVKEFLRDELGVGDLFVANLLEP